MGHQARDCRRDTPICRACNVRGHPSVLCDKYIREKVGERPQESARNSTKEQPKKKAKAEKGKWCTFLQTFICPISGNAGGARKREIRGLLDPGSDRSYILQGVAHEMNLQLGKNVRLECSSFLQGETQTVEVTEVMVSLYNRGNSARTYRFHVTPCITGELLTAPSAQIVKELLPQHLNYADLDLFSNERRPIELLIGNDIYHEVVNVTQSRILSKEFVLLNSFFGWIPSGNCQEERQSSSTMCAMTSLVDPNKESDENEALSRPGNSPGSSDLITDDTTQPGMDKSELEKLWSLELIGIEHPDKHLGED